MRVRDPGAPLTLEEFRSRFPALRRLAWLDTATAPPAAAPVARALREALDEWETGSFDWRDRWEADAEASRALFARLVGAPPERVALLPFAAAAATTVARSLPRGRVVVGACEFRSNLFPWLALREHGFDVATVPLGRLAEAVDSATVLVAVSAVQSADGVRVPLRPVAEAAHAAGARLYVNLTQALGVLRFDVRDLEPDYVACHGYKWLLCPRGAAFLYARGDRIDELRPLAPSWKDAGDGRYYGEPYALAADARRADGSLAWLSWVGARRALELLLALDPGAVEARALALAAALREAAAARGLAVVDPVEPSQIVAIEVADPDALRGRLRAAGVAAAVRDRYLRAGFHGFNDEADLDRAAAALGC